jgi:hypothetical protein
MRSVPSGLSCNSAMMLGTSSEIAFSFAAFSAVIKIAERYL